jgi:hypothetical protein
LQVYQKYYRWNIIDTENNLMALKVLSWHSYQKYYRWKYFGTEGTILA